MTPALDSQGHGDKGKQDAKGICCLHSLGLIRDLESQERGREREVEAGEVNEKKTDKCNTEKVGEGIKKVTHAVQVLL